jgi:protein TonB
METKSILTANILDILFDGRNKEYGAYELRRTYNSRIGKALGTTITVIIISVIALINGTGSSVKISHRPDIDVTLSKKEIEKPVLPTPRSQQQQVRTVAFPPPVIVKDQLVKAPPVENKDLLDSRIDVKTIAGKIDNTIVPPTAINENPPVAEPVKETPNDNAIKDVVDVQARFVGNWGAYVKKEIEKNIDELTEAGESGTCVVRFIVSKDGTVSDVEAMTMRGSKLAEIAVNAIRKGGKWIPAMQNGREVNAYRQQPIIFKITD